jgi:hypothetical protein
VAEPVDNLIYIQEDKNSKFHERNESEVGKKGILGVAIVDAPTSRGVHFQLDIPLTPNFNTHLAFLASPRNNKNM